MKLNTPLVLNIPHSAWEIPEPCFEQFIVPDWALAYETLRLVDWFTDELFMAGGRRVVAPVNRLLVDTERFDDDRLEPMAAHGMGCVYERGTRGQLIRRQLSDEERRSLLDTYYHPHHRALEQAVFHTLEESGCCFLVDCHSFPDEPFPYEDHGGTRPDICLGSDPRNTPVELLRSLQVAFEARGYSVAIDTPFSGCVVPPAHHGDARLAAVMIEVNRRLYLEPQVYPYDARLLQEYQPPRRNAAFARVCSDLHRIIRQTAQQMAELNGAPSAEGGADPEAALSDSRQPGDQKMLTRFLMESDRGQLSPEMARWWWDRY